MGKIEKGVFTLSSKGHPTVFGKIRRKKYTELKTFQLKNKNKNTYLGKTLCLKQKDVSNTYSCSYHSHTCFPTTLLCPFCYKHERKLCIHLSFISNVQTLLLDFFCFYSTTSALQ